MFEGNIKYYKGTITKDVDDEEHRGRYLVFIDELHSLSSSNDKNKDGIWCSNRLSNVSNDAKFGNFGSYFPIFVGCRVKVQITGSAETGEIVGLLSDQSASNKFVPFDTPAQEQTQITQIFKTMKFGNTFVVTESTTEAPNSIHLYYNSDTGTPYGKSGSKNRTKIIINEDGINIYSADSLNVSIDNESNILVEGDAKLTVKGKTDLHLIGETKLKVDGPLHIKSDSVINIDGASVNIMGGGASTAEDSEGFNKFNPKELKVSRSSETDVSNKIRNSDLS
ncbi:MAG: hypothetical protein H7836_12405 [Magnetococcus sp. YQC-3]